MTNRTSTSQPDSIDHGTAMPPDPRPAFRTTIEQVGATIAVARPDQLDLPTPCPGWTVRDLLAHLVAVADRVTAVGRGEVAEGEVVPPTGIADDGWSAAWTVAADGAIRQWERDDVLGRIVSPPFGQMPGAIALSIYATELTVHHWDLATSIGASVRWDDHIVGAALAGTVATLPAEGRGVEVPFGEVVPVPDDASAIDRLVAYLGRRP